MFRLGDIAIYYLPSSLGLLGLLLAFAAYMAFAARRRLWRVPGLVAALLAPLLMAATVAGLPIAPTNAIMAAYPSWQFFAVLRLGVNTPGDAAPEWFVPSSMACSISGGDVGSEVPAVNGGCFNAILPALGADVRNWNHLTTAMTGGTADATASVQAAINAVGAINGTLLLGGQNYGIDSSGLTCSAPEIIDGGNPNAQNTSATIGTGGFITLAQNNTILTLAAGCKGTRLQNLYFGMEGFGENTAGAAISMSGFPSLVVMDNIAIFGACIGIDLAGNGDWVFNSLIAQEQGGIASGCAGIRYGQYGGTANIGGGIVGTTIQGNGNPTTTAEYGMQLVQVGGAYVERNDILYTYYGTAVTPGASQMVDWFFGTNTVLGDTTESSPLYINPAVASGNVKGFHCVNCWEATTSSTAEFGNPNASPNVQLLDSNGGTVTGTVLDANWNYGGYDNVLVGTGVVDTTISGSHLCSDGIGATSGTYYGVELQSAVAHVQLVGNRISPTCDGAVGGTGTTYAVGFDSSNQAGVVVTDNDLVGNSGGPFSGSPGYAGSGSTTTNIIANNGGLTPQASASASTITLGVVEDLNLTGTVTINELDTCWPGRTLWVHSPAATPFGTSGNIAAAFTMTAAVPALARCEYQTGAAGLWSLK